MTSGRWRNNGDRDSPELEHAEEFWEEDMGESGADEYWGGDVPRVMLTVKQIGATTAAPRSDARARQSRVGRSTRGH